MKTVSLGRGAECKPAVESRVRAVASELGFHPELCDPHAPTTGAFDIREKAALSNRSAAVALHIKSEGGSDMGIIAWIVVGLIAGWLAGQVMKGGGYGVLVDIVLGVLGGVVGGWVFGLLGIWPGGGMIGSIIVAFVGAVILVWITRILKRA
jgi:uncharacterized membrane protein YeaQ/YmgE (transglycosylase-associated protein family)